jgi:hypothetical protein
MRAAVEVVMAIGAAAVVSKPVPRRSVGTQRGSGGGAAMQGRGGRRLRRELGSVFALHGPADRASTLQSMNKA